MSIPHEPTHSLSRPLTVLVVEDDDSLMRYVQAVVPAADKGITVLGVRTLAEALQGLRAVKVDVILLDLSLPDANEIEALIALRKAAAHIPIVVFSGGGASMAELSFSEGAQDFISKGDNSGPKHIVRAIRHADARAQVQARFQHVHDSLAETEKALLEAEMLKRRCEEVLPTPRDPDTTKQAQG